MLFAEAWFGVALAVAVAFVFFTVSAMDGLLCAEFAANLWGVIMRLTNGFVISELKTQ